MFHKVFSPFRLWLILYMGSQPNGGGLTKAISVSYIWKWRPKSIQKSVGSLCFTGLRVVISSMISICLWRGKLLGWLCFIFAQLSIPKQPIFSYGFPGLLEIARLAGGISVIIWDRQVSQRSDFSHGAISRSTSRKTKMSTWKSMGLEDVYFLFK